MKQSTKSTFVNPSGLIHPTNLITFGSAISRPEALKTMPVANLMAMLKQGNWRRQIEALREESNPQRQKELKLRLPYFVYGVVEHKREDANVRQINGIVFDFDHLEDPEDFKAKVFLHVPWARYVFRSPVDGVKVLIQFSRPIWDRAEYQAVWNFLRAEIKERIGFSADNTPDVSRACFVSWDEDFFDVEGAEEFDPDSVKDQWNTDKAIDVIEDDKEIMDIKSSCHQCSIPTDLTEVQTRSAVEHLCRIKLNWRDWSRCGIALYNHYGEEGRKYWMLFADNPHYDDTADALAKQWERLKKYTGVNIGTLFYIAEQNGWINAVGSGFSDIKPQPNPSHSGLDPEPSLLAPEGRNSIAVGASAPRNGSEDMNGAPEGATQSGLTQSKDDETMECRLSGAPAEKTNAGMTEKDASLSLCPSVLSNKTLADFPELLELFGKAQNINLDRSQLPDIINGYIDLVGRITDAQEGARLTAFLPVIASCIGNRVYMYNAGTRHYCNIWAAIIGPSTVSRKTTVINQAMKMLQPFKDALGELTAKERNERDIELTRVTQARLYNLLSINSNRLILQMELSAWMQEMNKAYNAGMKQEITDMFDGKDRSIAKIDIDEYIRKPAFSIVGATTEDWFYRELREVADQRGGFLQRFIICIIQNIDVESLRFDSMVSPEYDSELFAWDEMLCVFRGLPGSNRLLAEQSALDYRNAIYADLMKRVALSANDPQAAYCARIFDNYFWRFCILIHLLKNWMDIREAQGNDHLATWFLRCKVDEQTAREAWYLCEYYFQNTRPFLQALSENSKLDSERKIIRILQKEPNRELTHSRLLCRSHLSSREFRQSMESLIERQAVLCHEETGYRNRIGIKYTLNPVLNDIEIN